MMDSQHPDARIRIVPPLERTRLQIYLLQLVGDGAALLFGFMLAGEIYVGSPFDDSIWPVAQVFLPIYWTGALYNRTYSVDALVSGAHGFRRMAQALLASVIVLVMVLFATKSSIETSRAAFGLAVVLAAALMGWLRVNLQPRIRRAVGPRAVNLLLIDDGGPPIVASRDAVELPVQPPPDRDADHTGHRTLTAGHQRRRRERPHRHPEHRHDCSPVSAARTPPSAARTWPRNVGGSGVEIQSGVDNAK